ncbi:MAG: hypothetical protein IJX67_02275 [Oscillospiraceae bacterium]|nr:hypothetical protein [Oscillospiraceae bacterium]
MPMYLPHIPVCGWAVVLAGFSIWATEFPARWPRRTF